jgi:hypothetical protein
MKPQGGWAKSKYQSGPDRIVKSSLLQQRALAAQFLEERAKSFDKSWNELME